MSRRFEPQPSINAYRLAQSQGKNVTIPQSIMNQSNNIQSNQYTPQPNSMQYNQPIMNQSNQYTPQPNSMEYNQPNSIQSNQYIPQPIIIEYSNISIM
jgi:hypothetical protein